MRILIFGHIPGVPQLLKHLPKETIVGVVGASIRPQYLTELGQLADQSRVTFLVQPKWRPEAYEDFKQHVATLRADLIWVNSYSMIIRNDVLALSRLGGLNIHAALLPRNRGCNPTQWAILNGDHETGVTLREIDSGIDTGPVIDQRKVPIFFEDTWLEVRDRLTASTDDLIEANREKILSENWSSVSQIEALASVGRRRTPDDGAFSWTEPVAALYNKIRALLAPLPPAFYQDGSDQKREITPYQTLWQLAAQKYDPSVGGGRYAV